MASPRKIDGRIFNDWRMILMEWLDWPEERFLRFVESIEGFYSRGNMWDWFDHDDHFEDVLPCLIPDLLADELAARHTTAHDPNDLFHLKRALIPAIYGGSRIDEGFDWPAARQRVEALLAEYGVSLPSAPYVTSYERGRLEDGHAFRPDLCN